MAQKSSSPSINGTSTTSNIEFQKIILALLIIVTIGYFLLLILAPTNMYYNIWTPKIIAHTSNSTYFGAQGKTLLMNTFPFLFVAVLGCLYLHLSMKSNDRNINNNILSSSNTYTTLYQVSIAIKGEGSWSKKLYQMISSPNSVDRLNVSGLAVLNMLIICISIVITSSAAFAWNKRQSGTDAKQIQNMEGATILWLRLILGSIMLIGRWRVYPNSHFFNQLISIMVIGLTSKVDCCLRGKNQTLEY